MCGIIGFVDKRSKKDKLNILENMGNQIIYRGPDGVGYFADDLVGFAQRRLAIIDVKGGAQPMYSEDNKYIIIFNGEIYNYQALRDELIELGYKFKTKTDTEVILNGYIQWKDKLYTKLRGMFSFVIYDVDNKDIVGARDYFGIKPFYYYLTADEFMFSSEIKAFFPHPGFDKKVNTDGLKMFLIFQYNVKNETFFKDVHKLEPGEYFHFKDGKLDIKKYFEISFDKKNNNKSYEQIKSELKDVLEDSIHMHQITSDVEVGSYLSGGVDSSYVVAKSLPDKTFSVGFNYEGFDETTYAKELSDMLKLKNYREVISPDDFFKYLPDVEYHTDEPDANLSTVPLYFLSDLASKQVKVVLSGEGSDEMFGGYPEYNDPPALTRYLKLPLPIRAGVRGVCKCLPHFPGRNTLIKYGRPFTERYLGHGSYFEESEINRLLAKPLKSNEKISDVLKPYYDKVKDEDELTQKIFIDYHFWLPQDILLKADKMAMSHGVELRTPLMDINVFNYARTIPSKYLIKDRVGKYIFRDIARDTLPEEWSKRSKLGFPVPFSKWLMIDKYYDIVASYFNEDYASKFFDQKYLLKLLSDHRSGKHNNGRKIWNCYAFLVWYKRFFIDIS
jgi:asparagine synthase (glutamine-hydrolysing)